MSLVPVTALAAFAVCAAGAFALAHPRSPLRWLDEPGHRSLHDTPTPRTGAMPVAAVVLTALVAMAVADAAPGGWWLVALATALVAAVSFADDWRGVRARWRAAVHVLAAVLAVSAVGAPRALAVPGAELALPGWLTFVPAVALLVWMTNLYNFMDGMDGFAGGMGVIGFGTLALLAFEPQAPALAWLFAVTSAACGGFLLANFPPARIFAGDVGAASLGFLAGAGILAGARAGAFEWWQGVLAFGPFVADATVTLARRAVRRERLWEGHRSHFYQRVVALGWSHRRTVLAEYGLMVLSAGMALAAAGAAPAAGWIVVSLVALTYTALMLLVTHIESRRRDS